MAEEGWVLMRIIKNNGLKNAKIASIVRQLFPQSILLILFIVLLAVYFLSMMIGRYAISFQEINTALFLKLFHHPTELFQSTIQTVLFQVRLPRITAAVLIGAALSVSGSAYQGMFRNPMVSPDILGASAGAGFGAALGILLSLGIVWIQVLSFAFGLLAVLITYFLSARFGKGDHGVLVLVLTGMVVGTLFTSFVSLIKYIADPYSKLPAITFWLMGSLASINPKDLGIIGIPVVLGAIPLLLLRWRMNVLVFGEEEARAMGVDTKKLQGIIILGSTLMTAASVSVSGMIGWVGLVIPHLARMIVGPDYRILLPASILIGGAYLLVVDDIARNLFTMEIPLGILTSLIGAPFFIYLLIHGKKGWV